MADVRQILSRIESGDPTAAEQLLPLVYVELRRLAHRWAQKSPGQTLEATALVHEAHLRLVDAQQAQHWNSRGHIFWPVAEAVRRRFLALRGELDFWGQNCRVLARALERRLWNSRALWRRTVPKVLALWAPKRAYTRHIKSVDLARSVEDEPVRTTAVWTKAESQ